jgi:hypothetical protein
LVTFSIPGRRVRRGGCRRLDRGGSALKGLNVEIILECTAFGAFRKL